MTSSTHSTQRDLVGALKSQTVRTGASTPSVRGADWRLATVTAVGAGTVTADGILVRCLETYTMPVIGDVIVISQSSSGNWVAHGRTAAAAPPAMVTYTPTWTASTTNPTLGNGTLSGRYWRNGPIVKGAINLTIGSTTGLGSGNYTWQLPTNIGGLIDICPVQLLTAANSRWAGQGVIASADVNKLGVYMPIAAGNSALIRVSSGTANPAGAFVTGDQLRISFQYEAAA